jgi:sphingosine kinase
MWLEYGVKQNLIIKLLSQVEKEIFQRNSLELTFDILEYAGYARDYVQRLELSEWSGIVVASGDGLVYEVINGLLSRNDWQEALKLPIGHLPCGSGNAFITSIIRCSK